MTHLPKRLRNALDDFDCEAFDHYLRVGNYATLVRLYDLVAEHYKAGYPLNEDHQQVLLYPMKKWGNQSGRVMFEMKKAYWEHHQNKQPKPEPEKRTREQYEDKLKAFRASA